jgi:hypothetical protein
LNTFCHKEVFYWYGARIAAWKDNLSPALSPNDRLGLSVWSSFGRSGLDYQPSDEFCAWLCSVLCSDLLRYIGTLIYTTATHRTVDFALTYKWGGLPVGLLVLVAALAYLGTLWVRRQLRKE